MRPITNLWMTCKVTSYLSEHSIVNYAIVIFILSDIPWPSVISSKTQEKTKSTAQNGEFKQYQCCKSDSMPQWAVSVCAQKVYHKGEKDGLNYHDNDFKISSFLIVILQIIFWSPWQTCSRLHCRCLGLNRYCKKRWRLILDRILTLSIGWWGLLSVLSARSPNYNGANPIVT